jgi:hypothetical protein
MHPENVMLLQMIAFAVDMVGMAALFWQVDPIKHRQGGPDLMMTFCFGIALIYTVCTTRTIHECMIFLVTCCKSSEYLDNDTFDTGRGGCFSAQRG